MRADVILLLGATLAPTAQAPPTAPSTRPSGGGAELVCETYCHPTKLRTSCARLRLVLADSVDAVTGIKKSAPSTLSRLEVTVFKNGFEKGLYSTFSSVRPSAPGRQSAPEAGPPVPAPALAKRPPQRAFNIRVGEPDASAPFGTDGVTIEGLEPGTLYTWRVWTGAAAGDTSFQVSCEAPTCPADMVRPRGERPEGDQ